MDETTEIEGTAFLGSRRIASGRLPEVAAEVVNRVPPEELSRVLIFNNTDSRIIEVDFCGSREAVLRRLQPRQPEGAEQGEAPRRRRGRPRLGVVAREVTLLPRHWEWLSGQPGGASVALRKLVEEARRGNSHRDRVRSAREATYRFMSAMAGDLPGFEEAARALFAGEEAIFRGEIAAWPEDIRTHVEKLSEVAFTNARAAGRGGEKSC